MIAKLANKISSKSVKEQLEFLAKEFKGQIAFSTSFGQEDQVITDIIFKNNIPIEIFTLDTDECLKKHIKFGMTPTKNIIKK